MQSLKVSRRFRLVPSYVALLALAAPFIYPFIWMASGALKTNNEMFAFPPALIPVNPQWQNFADAFTYQPFARQYVNSLYIAALVTIGVALVSSLSGYAFARIRFPGSNIIFLLLLSALMLPTEVSIIPNFALASALGVTNTHIPLIVIPIFGAGSVFGTFMMRQFFLNLPRDIEESGMLDGLNRFGIFTRIALPLAQPALGALAILTFLASWNAYLEPLIYLNDLAMFTLPLALNNFNDSYGLPIWNLQLAATTMSVLPVLILYVVAQRHIINSFMFSGTKG